MVQSPVENSSEGGANKAAEPRVPFRWNSPVITISAGYASLATLWIFYSDHALALLARTPERMVDWSVYKGFAFVAVTAVFLFLLLRKTYGALEEANAKLRRRSQELRRLGRLNAALSHINQAIVRMPVREELFQRVCDVLTEHGGFRLAWIGWRDADDERLLPVAMAGEWIDYVGCIRVHVDERPEGLGPAGRSFRSGSAQVCNDVLADPALQPWREAMQRRGVRSIVALPIREGGVVGGVLIVYSEEPEFFQRGEMALLEEAVGDIAFALDNLAREAGRRRAEEAAAAERSFSATMVDSMPGVMYFCDHDLSFLRWNRNLERVSGFTAGEIARMHPHDFLAPDDRSLARERIAEVFARGESTFAATFLAKNGGRTPYFFTGRRVDFSGRPCIVGVGIDISERTRAEAALRESEERFRATFEQAAVGIAHVSPDGRFRWVNDQLCAITGWTREELLGMTGDELTYPEDRAESEAARRGMIAGEREEFSGEKRYRRKDGGTVWVSVFVKVIRDAGGRADYFVAVVADISERKRLEQQFLRSQRMESIGTLAGGIAHDLNNLLAPIMMGIELLRQSRLPPPAAATMDGMERSARRAAGLVRQVLSFARGVEGARTRLNPVDVLREVEAFVRSSFPRDVVCRCELPPALWPVMGDATQLHQVLLNLCVNARDALAGRGGRLTLRAADVVLDASQLDAARGETPGRHVLIEVSDDGCGMTPEVRARIFEPFFTTKPPGKGTGLGLSTTLGIVRSHGGRVEVESEPEKGSTFRIFLPARPDEVADEGARPAAEKPRLGDGELILVIDDESSLLEVTRQMLGAFGYRVLTASDGAFGLALFEQRRADIAAVIADLRLPAPDGGDLPAALRRIEPAVRIVGVGGPARGEAPADAGAFPRYSLRKPYAADTLLEVLRRALAAK